MLEPPKGLQELIEKFEEQSRNNSQDIALLLKLGRLFVKNGSFDDAIRIFRKILAIDEKHLQGILELSLCFAKIRQFDEAIFHLERAQEIYPKNSSVLLAFAKLYEMMGNWEQQAAFLMRAANIGQGKPEIRLYLADLMRKLGDLNGAAQQYEIVLKDSPDLEIAHFNLGTILMKQNRLNEAISHFRAVTGKNPSAHDAHLNLAICLYRQEKFGLAVPSFVAGLKGIKNNPSAHFMLAQCYYHIGDWDRGLVIMEKLAETHRDNIEIQSALGEFYLKTGELRSAKEVFSRLRKKFPERSEFSLKTVDILIALELFDEAVGILEELFITHPGHIEGHRILGEIYFRKGENKAALEEFKRTLLINDSYFPGYLGIAKVSKSMGDKHQEYSALKKAYEINNSDVAVILRLGELERLLDMPVSLERFKKVLELAPESVQAKEAQYYLRHTSVKLNLNSPNQ